MENVTNEGFTKMRRSSIGDLNLSDKGAGPAVIVSMASRKLTMRATPCSGTQVPSGPPAGSG
jgi:hypothetical protein